MKNTAEIFKAYDVRGIYPDQFNETIAARIAQAYAAVRKPRTVAVGRDVRGSGEKIKNSLILSLLDSGVNVVDIGVVTTDQLYFAVGNYGFDGGISVTASHNPSEYNGLKFSESGGAPISSESLLTMRDWVASDNNLPKNRKARLQTLNIHDKYVEHVLSYIDTSSIKPLSIVANANFGAVGRIVDEIAKRLKLNITRLNWQEDGAFPKGPPNPLLPSNRDETQTIIKSARPDLGVAWDADADRVFFFTHEGKFIPSCFVVAILAKYFLEKYPGSKIVHDITTAWAIDETVKKAGGQPIINRTGHTFIKARMRQEDAPFAGESSGHYYFRDSFYADNGIVPLLIILQMISKANLSLKELVRPLMEQYKVSGEINFQVADPAAALALVEKQFGSRGRIDKTDGMVVETDKWRFSVRPSNTEPLFRLNAEALDQEILDNLVSEISSLINT